MAAFAEGSVGGREMGITWRINRPPKAKIYKKSS